MGTLALDATNGSVKRLKGGIVSVHFLPEFLGQISFLKKKKEMLNLSPLQTSSQRNGDGEEKDPSTHLPPPMDLSRLQFYLFPLFPS